MVSHSKQLVLPISVDPDATWSHWVSRAETAEIEHAVKRSVAEKTQGVFLWGDEGMGKSHILQAVCAAFSGRVRFIPLGVVLDHPPEAFLEGAEAEDLVLIDDVHLAVQNRQWQEGLFHCFNRCTQCETPILLASRLAPAALTAILPDLQSRYAALPVFKLPNWGLDAFQNLLEHLARSRHLTLSPEVVNYLSLRIRPIPASAVDAIALIDQSSLEAQRSPTIPFLKTLGF